ncbi:FMN-binding protein [Nocardioides iriomotensis]|uniref:FMN-binding protein n=2 Tax=Nocardioides iriomotensis TaxID=715784 RepID=A0A4Q5J3Q0_9ACTN|nr:FMN-binding protein [Nocardioides iriomotensis]
MGALVTAAESPSASTTTSGATAAPAAGAAGAAGGTDPSATRTVTGPTVQTQWGPVQVQLTLKGGTITDVSVLQKPSGNPQDDAINSYALPILVRETLGRQSAQIDMVSGATVTSVGYLQSLQSALDQAGV